MLPPTATSSTTPSSPGSSVDDSSSDAETGRGATRAASIGASHDLIDQTRTCIAWGAPGVLCVISGIYLLVSSSDDQHGSKSLHFVAGLLCLAAAIGVLLVYAKTRMLNSVN